MDLEAEAGTSVVVGGTRVTIIDPFEVYIDCLMKSFDFGVLKKVRTRCCARSKATSIKNNY